MSPVLGYSLASFHPGGYDLAADWLARLWQLRFNTVTLTPTYLVYDESPPRLDVTRGPSFEELAGVIAAAREAGMRVRLEPHLDFESTLTGGPYVWRSRMDLQPRYGYFDDVLAPLAALGPDSLTLGSELGDSLLRYPEQWDYVRAQLAENAMRLGHKINHDSWNQLNADSREYLYGLDWVSYSFYPAMVRADTPEIEGHLRRLAANLEGGPEFVVGEMGLGSSDVTRPWHFDSATFATPEALAIRQRFYLDLLAALQRCGDLFGEEGAVFWTVTHFDILGVMDASWGDEAVIDAVLAHNGASS